MTTTGSSMSDSGQARGRGLDALFAANPPVASSAPDIDPELAAMLDQEVRAGAPPVESLSAIPTAKERAALAASPNGEAQEASAAGAELGPQRLRRGDVATAGDEAIDIPMPVADGGGEIAPPAVQPPASPPADSAEAPPTPPPAVTPPTGEPPPTPSPGPGPAVGSTPVGGAPQAQPPVRIGAVIIDSTAPGAAQPAAPGEPAVQVGPAGELIPAGQPGAQVAVAPMPDLREVLPPGPGVQPTPQPLPTAQALAEDQKTIIINRLNKNLETGWQKSLHVRIDDLYKQVATEFSSPPTGADRMLTLLNEARQILIESPENYVAVESRMVQVQVMITRTAESRRQSAHYGPRILGYEVGWLVLLLLGLVFAAPLTDFFARAGNITGATGSDLFPFWSTLMWGGIGGIIGALYALWWHVSDQQDFERQYVMWYLVQPIMGVVLGGIVFLLLTGGFLLLQVKPSDTNTGARLIPYLVAVLAGFRQNFVYGQFDRLIALFAPGDHQSRNTQRPGGGLAG